MAGVGRLQLARDGEADGAAEAGSGFHEGLGFCWLGQVGLHRVIVLPGGGWCKERPHPVGVAGGMTLSR
jgi:hypothetical protein